VGRAEKGRGWLNLAKGGLQGEGRECAGTETRSMVVEREGEGGAHKIGSSEIATKSRKKKRKHRKNKRPNGVGKGVTFTRIGERGGPKRTSGLGCLKEQ